MSVARDLFDLRTAGLYLPSLVLLIVNPEIPWLSNRLPAVPWIPVISLFSLIFAVSYHGLIRNVFGIGGPEENPMRNEDVIQGIQVAVTGKGPHEEQPNTPLGMLGNLSQNPSMLGRFWVFKSIIWVVGSVIWIGSVPFSIIAATLQYSQLSASVKFLLFAEYVWVLQWLLWRNFHPSYLMNETDFE